MPSASAPAPTDLAGASTRSGSRSSRLLEAAARRTNMMTGVAALAQFYSAGLAVFGAASFTLHARIGWLVQVAAFVTLLLLTIARVRFRVSRLAILLFVLAVLQPVLAFAPRASVPALSALHPVNGLAILAVCVLLERTLRGRS